MDTVGSVETYVQHMLSGSFDASSVTARLAISGLGECLHVLSTGNYGSTVLIGTPTSPLSPLPSPLSPLPSPLSPLPSPLSPLPSPLSPLLPFVLLLIIDSAISRLLNTDATAYWLIKIEILETLSKINYAVLHYLEQSPYNRAFHPVDQTHKGSSRSLQARVLDRILLNFGEKEGRREGEKGD